MGVTLLRDSGLGNFAFAAPAKISERAKTARQKWQCSRKRGRCRFTASEDCRNPQDDVVKICVNWASAPVIKESISNSLSELWRIPI